MGERIIKLPDVGEGVAEAELVEWHVKVGDIGARGPGARRRHDRQGDGRDPVAGRRHVVALGGEVGDMLAVGCRLVRLEVASGGTEEVQAAPRQAAAPEPRRSDAPVRPRRRARSPRRPRSHAPRPSRRACPAVATAGDGEAARVAGRAPARARGRHRSAPGARQRTGGPHRPRGPRRLPARRAGAATGGGTGRQHRGRDHQGGRPAPAHRPEDGGVEARIPHITYVEEVDVTALEELRAALNAQRKPSRASEADAAAVPDAGAGQGDRRLPPDERAVRRRGRDIDRTAASISASPRRRRPG